ncbi:alpha-2-macroglobulin family protein [Nitratireductor kimnyeongensis]|uniref:Alpha-2-macroglobulin family protein n=1 Tax=Nitratireductor kimnyeongensis TaxID=430679 RepID=A0ABW0TCM4_9HYPH|nr:alpha-2-macroglobulin family protein [Nitratireductor kimnyeongensis]QZZ36745.1 alpha-2-macroglobulin family protein [Nitratireductor kimnyeongensis]
MAMFGARGLSLFFVFLFGFAALAAAQDARRIVTSENADYFGFDLRTEKDVTLDQCKAVCLADPQCRAFTYNTSAQWCFLKSDFNRLNGFDGAVAGKVVASGDAPDIGAPPALRFVPDHIQREADDYRAEVLRTPRPENAGLVRLSSAGVQALANGDPLNAMKAFSTALVMEPKDTKLWSQLARAALAAQPAGNMNAYRLQRAGTGAAINAYNLSRSADDRAQALAVLAPALERRNLFRPALSAYEASLALKAARDVQEAYADLKRRKGFRVVDHSVDSDSATPRACVQFSESLVKNGVDYAQYVTVDTVRSFALDRSDKELCVSGLKHGEQYRIVIRQGLPAAIGEVIAEPVPLEIYVRDRAPSLRFTGDNFVLPSSARRGIPFVSVNADSANLSVYRVGERALAQLLGEGQFLRQLNQYGAREVVDDMGAPVFEGTIEIESQLNTDIVTSIPIDEAVPERKPGIYMMTAVPEGDRTEHWENRATQWFLVSDIGLSTFAGADGLSVFARSLARAEPLEGLKLKLLARNNEILGEAETDGDGHARFDPGLARGAAGLAPAAIIAENGAEDFVFFDMTRAGFDLSDRGVTGRPSAGPLDVLAWTERGIYRAGETVHASALTRNPASDAVEDLPLTFIFRRPDGVEHRRVVSDGAALGGHAVALDLPGSAMRGTWALGIYADPKKPALAEKNFLVEDFVPDRTEFELASADETVPVGGATDVTVDGRYLYGAPAAGLALEGELTVAPTREWKAFPGYVFGLDDEEDVEALRVSLPGLPETDAQGQARFPVALDGAPSTTRLLKAQVSVRMREAGGRAVERALEIDVEPESAMIGMKPEFTGGRVAEGATANFRVIAVDPKGERIAMDGLEWKLLKVERHYQWYREGGSWNYEPITTTSLVREGTVDAKADSEPQIGVSVDWGRYRLEVESPEAGGPITSVAFDSGWYVEAGSTETPDGLEVALDRDAYAVGDTAHLRISPRFAGEVLVTVGADSLIETYTANVAEAGATLDIPVTDAFGAGAYVTATLFRPGDDADNRLPMRAIGVRWLKVDPGTRDLPVDLGVEDQARPDESLSIPVSVGGLEPGEEAYVTVAAVDVGILNLTRYEPPEPDAWYFGQRMLGIEIRDIYGRLIDGSLGAMGRLRTGGDGGGMTTSGSAPTQKLLAFFSGIVKVDDEGKAVVTFDIPQFNGTARIMSVAWSKKGVGSAQKDVIIRDPVVLTTSLPRFLAPGDEARLLLEIANTDGPAGDYRIAVSGEGPVDVDLRSLSDTVTLEAGGKATLSVPISATNQTGEGALTVALAHESGLAVEKSVPLPVRPGVMPVATRSVVTLAANGGSVTLDGALLEDSFAENASVSLNISRADGFDIPALLMSLDRYPYGCTEQTTSRALPLLYVSELSKAAGLEDDPALKGRIEDAITSVLAAQSSSGSFGLWGPGSGDLWLDAYVTDFLTRAREQGFAVPEAAMSLSLQNLENTLSYDTDVASRGSEIAYALYVLARNRKASAGDLRYYLDTRLDEFSTPLARAQLAAGLALYGDAERAERGFASAFRLAQGMSGRYTARSDYGSRLRDGAAMLALAAESRPEPALVPRMIDLVSDVRGDTRYTSTQDEAWMLLAARALSQSSDDLSLTVDGNAHQGAFSRRLSGLEIEAAPLTVANQGDEPVDAVMTVVAAPQQPLPAGGEGFTIERRYYTLDGREANVSEARQNERYVVVLEMMEQNAWPSRVLVSDLLPAGFEIDNPRLVGSADLANFEWLGETDAVHTEFRDDRFIAAFNRNGGGNFRLAYVVRAVTPGVYTHPAASVEDMYRPQLSARTATGFMEIVGQ